jgi:hypothetical protein
LPTLDLAPLALVSALNKNSALSSSPASTKRGKVLFLSKNRVRGDAGYRVAKACIFSKAPETVRGIVFAGLAIGRSVDDLRKILGEPVSVRNDSKAGDNISAYPCGEAVLSFWVRSSVVYGITVTKAVPA